MYIIYIYKIVRETLCEIYGTCRPFLFCKILVNHEHNSPCTVKLCMPTGLAFCNFCSTVETRNSEIGGESTKFRSCGNFVGARMRQKRHGIYKKHILFPKVSKFALAGLTMQQFHASRSGISFATAQSSPHALVSDGGTALSPVPSSSAPTGEPSSGSAGSARISAESWTASCTQRRILRRCPFFSCPFPPH